MGWSVMAALVMLWLLGLIGQVGAGLHWLALAAAIVLLGLQLRGGQLRDR